jgi:hypothetical protein
MMTLSKLTIAGTLLMMPIIASAQSDDAKYCQALVKLYRATVPTTADPNAVAPVAIAKCNSGDTASGIPVLEKTLRDAQVTLPPRT